MGTSLPRHRTLIQEEYLANQNRSVMLGVTRQVFTLRADMARLRRFIDSYLNFVDDDMPPPFYFQPAVPFVTFELINYPYLTVASRNLIAYPQREMSFTIPLECYAIEDGVLVFKQYAFCVPFLYVDEEFSVVSGRDLFGLPKVAIKFEKLIDQGRPDVPTQIGRLTLRAPGVYGDHYVPFIEVYREPARYISLRKTPGNLLDALPDAIRGYSALTAETWEALARPPLRGFDNRRDLQSMLGMLRANAEMLAAGLPVFPFMREAPQFAESSADERLGPGIMDIISLKQARDAERPEFVSFQSLVRSSIYIDRINDGGLLFNPLMGDPNHDITVKIHHADGQPVVESLGLIAEETSSTGWSGQAPGASEQSANTPDPVTLVSTLKPLMPYWMNVDLAYGLGTNLYWRGKGTDWSSSDNPGPPADLNRYITIGSGALQEDASRIVSPDSYLWAFQLPLDPAKNGAERLNRLCAKYLSNDCYSFRLAQLPYSPTGPRYSVWMFIRKLDNTAEGRGPDLEQEISFATVLNWFHKKDGRAVGPPIAQVLMPLFVLTDNQTAVFTESEVFGCPTVRGEINFEGADWTATQFPTASMNASMLLMPELYSGDAAAWRRLIKVEVKLDNCEVGEGKPPAVLNLPVVGLKQIVDCRLPERVDFQAVVSRVLSVQPNKALPTPNKKIWTVNIYRWESVPLVEKMGLKVKCRKAGERTTIEVIEPCGVWSIPATVEELGAVNLAWRHGNSPWMSHKDPMAELQKIAPDIKTEITPILNQYLVNLSAFLKARQDRRNALSEKRKAVLAQQRKDRKGRKKPSSNG